MTKYPEIKAKLIGQDGNAYAIMATVARALRKGGVSEQEIEEYFGESTSGDYNNVIVTAMRWVTVK